ncbi:MAG: hypothetical protein BEN19_00620 [Epulopiscium sp. Nuni2H_MBin003]|nr:MAG: hypothetical protein BEN19_00620 [Epulopiscium sp. Nuni2H_MBin003]
MLKNFLYNPFNLGLLIIAILTTYMFTIRFYTPPLANVSINISSTDYNTEMQKITFTLDIPHDEYFLLIYEEGSEENWMYFTSDTYNNLDISKIFLPTEIEKYILFEGNSKISTFSFEVKPKYSLSYMNNKEYIFHLQLIVPFKPLFLPVFYYTKHYVFSIEPII